jgi:hypothetical protein
MKYDRSPYFWECIITELLETNFFSETYMDLKPFIRLTARRLVRRPELPADLAEFYAEHEGVGLECGIGPNRVVRLCKLDEVARVMWGDVAVADVPEGWEGFDAFQVGIGRFGEKIVYILDAPSCPPGSILAIGTNLVGCEGGDGPLKVDGSLVLAATFSGWLAHLERWGWTEPVIAATWELTEQERQELHQYYFAFNPSIQRSGG